jgi:hypothetical protein
MEPRDSLPYPETWMQSKPYLLNISLWYFTCALLSAMRCLHFRVFRQLFVWISCFFHACHVPEIMSVLMKKLSSFFFCSALYMLCRFGWNLVFCIAYGIFMVPLSNLIQYLTIFVNLWQHWNRKIGPDQPVYCPDQFLSTQHCPWLS